MKSLFVSIALLGLSTTALAQNPIIRDQFTADPTARVFNGKIYLYPSHDIPAPDDYARKDWFCMADYHVFSSENLVDWTDHGIIVDQKDVPWGDPKAYSMWAPDCIEKDGKYYFFFPDAPKPEEGQRGGGFGIGVAIADKPEGPFTVVSHKIEGVAGIDPCVLQASDGNSYIFWGGGGLRVAKLKDNLVELAEDNPTEVVKFGDREMKVVGVIADKTLPEGFKEGPFAFERNGKYYLTYPWVEDKTETLAYSMSDSPMGPYEYKGKIMEQSPTGCWTNHHSLVEYKGQWYLFYHHNDYSPNFDKNRSVCVDYLTFNEDGTIQPVKPTLRGVGVSNARSFIQIDRYSTISGNVELDYLNKDNTFEGWQLTYKGTDAKSTYNRVDFGQLQVNTISARVKAPKGGVLLVSDYGTEMPKWGNRPVPEEFKKAWPLIAAVQIPATSEYVTLTFPLQRSPKGVIDLTLSSKTGEEITVDWIGFDVRPELHASLTSTAPMQPREQGGFDTKTYRNVFAEMGYSQEAIDAKLQSLFDAVFTGPDRVYFEVGDDMGYISDVKNFDARTEGMSYGMMIAVQLNKKDIFDRLWRWAKKYMQHQDGPYKGYFAWSVSPDGTKRAMGPASDGELYFVTSLIFASNRWGNKTGIDYLDEAQNILNCSYNKDGKGGITPLIDKNTKLITFVPTGQGSDYTDPSYHLPAFYEVWARWANDGRADFYRECAKASREYLHKSIHPVTGLNPDYNNYDGSIIEGKWGCNDFRYDSWRVPMNIALDYSWACADKEWQQNYGHRFQNFLYQQGIDTYLDQYCIDGNAPIHPIQAAGMTELRHTPGLIATAAAVSLVCKHSKSREFIDRFWNSRHEPTATGYFDAYYEGLLRLFAFMHLSGNYQVIFPQ
ncbi:MAG: family 43 glycosylhydrolase [Bacteroidales bacterium]|nr:family 43 glycosylhydrolase [Candidatus Minthousia equi]